MNVFEILSTKYEDAWLQGKMGFRYEGPNNDVVIDRWDMDIPQPTPQEIASYEAEMLPIFQLNQVRDQILVLIEELFNRTAKEKRYGGAISCSTYINSSNAQWKAEAQAFVAWRDAVWQYSLTELERAKNGERVLVSAEEFLEELPAINWPA